MLKFFALLLFKCKLNIWSVKSISTEVLVCNRWKCSDARNIYETFWKQRVLVTDISFSNGFTSEANISLRYNEKGKSREMKAQYID